MKNLKKPISEDQKLFIKQYSLDERWNDQRIADELKISIHTVRKWRKKFGIQKSGDGVLSKDKSNFTKENINAVNITDDEKVEEWKKFFRTTSRYRRIQKQLLVDDLETFVDMWGLYCTQFTNLSTSDEEVLEMLIKFKMRLDDNVKNYKSLQLAEEDLKKLLNGRGDKELNLEDEKDRFVWETMQSNNRVMQETNKEMRELAAQYEKYFRMLNATREQREQQEKIGADTFLTLVRSMNDKEKRKVAGRYSELMKIAIQEQTKQLKELHKFSDGGLAPVIMLGEDYKKPIVENKDNKENK